MTEIAKCRCGAEAEWQISTDGKVGRWCRRCGIHGPWCDFEELMDAAWNALMRPRPVAEWRHGIPGSLDDLWTGGAHLGTIGTDGTRQGRWYASCLLDGAARDKFPDEDSARAWIEARVRAQGIEIRSVSDG